MRPYKRVSPVLTPRAYSKILSADSWEEIWEAGPYYDRISELLETADNYAVIVGWQIDSRLRLNRAETLREKVIRLCSDKPKLQIYFLFWDHAYLYVLEREPWQGRIWDEVHPRAHFIFDNRHPFGGSHHEKICLIDGHTALVGGIDLCDERWDDPQHLYTDPRRSLDGRREHHGPYHDMAIQVTGPVCAEILAHVAVRWKAISTIPFPLATSWVEPAPETQVVHRVYLSRTIAKIESGPHEHPVIREVEFLFRDLIQSAQSRLILEGQYFWSKQINDMLISKILSMKGVPFEVILILADLGRVKSFSRQMMAYELRLLSRLRNAANFAGVSLRMGCPYVFSKSGRSRPPRPVYIHSKVLIADDRFLGIGSANYATRALRIDTELHLTLESRNDFERAHIRHFAEALLAHWNIQGDNTSGIHLMALFPEVKLAHLTGSLRRTQYFPWHRFFDPEMPWLFGAKFHFIRIGRRYPITIYYGITLSWLTILTVFLSLGGAWKFLNSQAMVYLLLLASVWFFPVSFCFLTFLFVLQFGGYFGSELLARWVVLTFWTTAGFGYAWARAFPSRASGVFESEEVPAWVVGKVGRRNFEELIKVLLSPRVCTRIKIYYQGLYCVPLPWFFLGTILFQSSVIYTAVRWGGALMLSWFPELFHLFELKVGWPLMLAEILRGIYKVWYQRKYGKKPIAGGLL